MNNNELKEKIQTFLDSEDNELDLDFMPVRIYHNILDNLGYEHTDSDTNGYCIDFWYTYVKDDAQINLSGSLWDGKMMLDKQTEDEQ